MPKFCLLITCFILSGFYSYSQPTSVKADCMAINRLNTLVTNGSINKRKAAQAFRTLIERIQKNSTVISRTPWVFPLAGYNHKAIGGTNGSGYTVTGYNYFDGNKHSAHPAHDIFIKDNDQNNLDDGSHKPVNVLAVTDGIVIASDNQWQPGSAFRGGKYLWLYHPQLNLITYYAHNQNVFVAPGDIIKQGQKIAEVGRTGFNAFKKRSPTHLHFSAFKLIHSLPVPYNPYTALTQAKVQ